MKRIVVTGGLGYLGSRLLQSLARLNAEITVIDNLQSGDAGALQTLPLHSRVTFFAEDILKAPLDARFKEADAVIHLAAWVDPAASFQLRRKSKATNLEGTRKVARSARDAGATLIFPSTTSIFGISEKNLTEDTPHLVFRPQTPYAEDKLASEELIREIYKSSTAPYYILRQGTVFGNSPVMNWKTAAHHFCQQAINSKVVYYWSSALHQLRPYLDIEEVIRLYLFLLIKKPPRGIYHVASTHQQTSSILHLILKYTGARKLQSVDSPAMNSESFTVSTGKLSAAGFRFKDKLEKRLSEVLFSGHRWSLRNRR